MDVHPPDHAIHTWRDFLIHMATITLGLIIALGLEQMVDAAHRRHLLHEAQNNLHVELDANRKTLAEDQKNLRLSARQMLGILASIRKARQDPKSVTSNVTSASWAWSDLESSAWDTARNTNATALMSYSEAQDAADRYRQQDLVNQQAMAYIHSIYIVSVPVTVIQGPQDLTPAMLDRTEVSVQQALAELGQLQALCNGLQQAYDTAKPQH